MLKSGDEGDCCGSAMGEQRHGEQGARVGQAADSCYQTLLAKTDEAAFAHNSKTHQSTQAHVLQVLNPKKSPTRGF